MTIEIHLSGLPPTPNVTKTWHWGKKARETKKWRTMAGYQARANRPVKLLEPISKARITIVRGSSQPCDKDNAIASVKAILDGIVDARILLDDSPDVVSHIDYEWIKAPPNLGFIKIIVESV